jgi:probable HAF family extracellular repeat protein
VAALGIGAAGLATAAVAHNVTSGAGAAGGPLPRAAGTDQAQAGYAVAGGGPVMPGAAQQGQPAGSGQPSGSSGKTAAAQTTGQYGNPPPMGATSGRYRFRTIDNPADPTFNQLLGANDHGVIVGYFGSGADAAHPNKGYQLTGPNTRVRFMMENVPASAQTQVVGVNDHGTTVGFFVDAAGTNVGFVRHSGGDFCAVANPATPAKDRVNQLLGVNNWGVAVGFYNDAMGASHGYTYDTRTLKFTKVTLPVAADSVTATGINDKGAVVGFYTTGKITRGFLLQHGSFQHFRFGGGTNTQALGVNNAGQVVGSYVDAAGKMHGFVTSMGRLTTVDDPHGPGGTVVNGINNLGWLVGFSMDKAGRTNGFLAGRTTR